MEKVNDEIKKDINKLKQKNSNQTFFGLLFVVIIFGLIMYQGLTSNYIEIEAHWITHVISYEKQPNQFLLATTFSIAVVISFIYLIIKNQKNVKLNFKLINVFYIVVFLIISFPLWFFIISLIM